jgi:FAD-dependent oxidoreductase
MKVVTGFSHTIPKLACPGSGDGAGILISTQKYKNEITVDKAAMTVTADSGVGLRDLLDAVAASGLALLAAPYWDGLSLGGLLSTGSHGSSLWRRGGAVHDYVVSMRLVVPASRQEGYAKLITLRQGDPDLNAAKVSLGVLGVISKVTLVLEPQFNRNITNVVKDDADLEDEILPFAAAHEFGDLTWYPSQRKVVYRMDDRVPVTAPGNGLNDFIGFQSTAMAVIAGIRATESSLEASRNVKGKCMLARGVVASKLALANGLKNNEFIFTGYPVVGFQNRMQTSGSCQRSPSADLLSSCSWDPRFEGLSFYETTAIFKLSKIMAFISDVKKLRDMEPQSFCGVDVYNGFLIRFLKGSSAFLGQAEDSVVIDFNYYRTENGSKPRLNEDVWEEVEQMAFFKHGAAPHWAKNRNLAFLGAGAKYPNLKKFLRVMKKNDPDGLFSSDWSDKILLQGRYNSMAGEKADDGCALEGRCVCKEDSHCAPSEGFFCRPGKVYSEARVCRYQEGSSSSFLKR